MTLPGKETMPTTLAEAEAALATAHDAKESTRIASQNAANAAADLRAKLKAGGRGSSKITAADIAAADQAAEFAALAHQGAAADLPPLATAVKDARASEACDAVVAGLPALAENVVAALATIEAVLPQLVTGVGQYDEFVEAALERLQKVAPSLEPTYEAGSGVNPQRRGGTTASPFVDGAVSAPIDPQPVAVQPSRFRHPRHGVPTVDGVPLTSCRGAGQLAAVLLPTVRDLNGPQSLVEILKLLAAGAPQLPTP
jgi:hypothetical protein